MMVWLKHTTAGMQLHTAISCSGLHLRLLPCSSRTSPFLSYLSVINYKKIEYFVLIRERRGFLQFHVF
jgi:hypothetical protein